MHQLVLLVGVWDRARWNTWIFIDIDCTTKLDNQDLVTPPGDGYANRGRATAASIVGIVNFSNSYKDTPR